MRWIDSLDEFVGDSAEVSIGDDFPATGGGVALGTVITFSFGIYVYIQQWPTISGLELVGETIGELILFVVVLAISWTICSILYWILARGIYVVLWCIDQLAFTGIRIQKK